MKSTVVDESLSYVKTNVPFQRILQDFKINSTEWEIYIKEQKALSTAPHPPSSGAGM